MKETTPSSKRIILGVDPGTTVMGYGLIAVNGKQMKLLHMDELVMNSKENHYLRLQKIFEKTIAIIDEFHPDEMALEAPFFGKNVQSMLKLGRAQGGRHGCWSFQRIGDYRVFSEKNQNGNHWQWKCF